LSRMPTLTISKKQLLLFAVISGPLFVDIINGAINPVEGRLSIGQILRGLYMVMIVIYLLSHKRLIWISVTFLFFGLITLKELITLFIVQDYAFNLEIVYIFKILYVPLILIFLYLIIRKNSRITVNDLFLHLSLYGLIIAIGVLIAKLLGIGYKTYGDYSYGLTGIFLSPNDPGVALLVSYGGVLWLSLNGKSSIRWIPFVLVPWALYTIGTRASIMGIFLVPLLFVFILLTAKYIALRRVCFILGVFVIIGVVAGNEVVRRITLDPYLQYKFISLFSGQHPHKVLYDIGIERLSTRPLIYNMFGEGVSNFMYNIQTMGGFLSASKYGKRVEVDWIDVIGYFGIFFAVIIYVFYIYFLYISLIKYISTRKLEFGVAFICIGVFLGHSFLAGHAIYKPLPGGAVAVAMAFLLAEKKLYKYNQK